MELSPSSSWDLVLGECRVGKGAGSQSVVSGVATISLTAKQQQVFRGFRSCSGVCVYLGYLALWPGCTHRAYVYVLVRVSGIRTRHESPRKKQGCLSASKLFILIIQVRLHLFAIQIFHTPITTRCNLFSLAVLSWPVGGGGQFKLLLNHIYANDANDDNDANNNNDSMVTQISRRARLKNRASRIIQTLFSWQTIMCGILNCAVNFCILNSCVF